MTVFDLFHCSITLHDQTAPTHLLVAHSFIQDVVKGVGAQHADDQRGVLLRKGLRRPLNELVKVEQENGLYLVLARSLGAGRGAEQEERQDKAPSSKRQTPGKLLTESSRPISPPQAKVGAWC